MKTIIHVNQAILRRNMKSGTSEPCLIVRNYKHTEYASSVIINGPSKVVYQPHQPLNCGARAWVETQSDVKCD